MKRYLIGLLISMICLNTFVSTVNASEASNSAIVEASSMEWDYSSEFASFPVNLYENDQIVFSSHSERIAFYQIPNDILEDITTQNLLDLIKNYPLMCNLYAYDTVQEGYDVLKREFNGFDAFLLREDCFEIALEDYSDLIIPEETLLDYDALVNEDTYAEDINRIVNDDDLCDKAEYDMSVGYVCDILELIIAEIIKEEEVSSAETTLLMKVLYDKMLEKEKSAYFSDRNSSILINEIAQLPDTNSVKTAFYKSPASNLVTDSTTRIATSYTIYTPSGTPVSCDYNTDGYYDSPAENASLADAYGAIVVSSAPSTYNCHSFAWLQSLYPSIFTYLWLDSASAFAADPAYMEEMTPSRAGEIAFWGNGLHSAIVYSVSTYNPAKQRPEPEFISKWGAHAIFRHFPDNCPYGVSPFGIEYYY